MLSAIFRRAGASSRYARQKPGLGLLAAAHEAVEHCGVDGTGRHGVDAHAGRRAFERGALGETLDRVLARGVNGRADSRAARS